MSFSMKGFPLFSGFVAFLGTLASAATINVDIDKEYQRISGFGAASAWAGSITDKNAADALVFLVNIYVYRCCAGKGAQKRDGPCKKRNSLH